MSTNDTLRGLLPCPFCGETLAVSKSKLAAHPRFSECLLAQNVVDMDNPKQVDKWNTRIDAALAEPVSGGAVLPERAELSKFPEYHDEGWQQEMADAYNRCLDDVAALNGGAVAGQVETDVLQAIRENRISLTPEYEGRWHAELFGDEAEPQFSAEAFTPLDAINAVLLERERAEFHQHLRNCTEKVKAPAKAEPVKQCDYCKRQGRDACTCKGGD